MGSRFMKKLRQWLAKNILSRGQHQVDKAKDSEGSEADGSFQDAYKKFASAALLDPENAEVTHYWGLALYEQACHKQSKEAKELYQAACEKFEAALKLAPGNAKIMNDWGAALMAQARNKSDKQAESLYVEAKEKIAAAEALEPGSAAYNLACIHSLRGEPEECRKFLEQAQQGGNLPPKKHLETDKDLDNVKEEKWFQAFLKEISEIEHSKKVSSPSLKSS
jgi:tetratricopeptide (TPR) repeat protein